MKSSDKASIVKQVTKELLTKLPLLLNSPKVKEESEKRKLYRKQFLKDKSVKPTTHNGGNTNKT